MHVHIPRTAGLALRGHLRKHVGRVVSGHKWWEAPAPDGPVQIIVLREPTERVSSLYDYIRTCPSGHKHKEWLGRVTLAELMRDPATKTVLFSNGQARQLCGIAANGQEMTAGHVELAWENLNRPEVIAVPLEYLNEGVALLGRRLGLPIPPLTRVYNAVPREVTDRETAQAIRRLNAWDVLLYARLLARWQTVLA